MSPLRAVLPLIVVVALVAPSAAAVHANFLGVSAVGTLTHRVYVDGALVCEDVGEFYGSSAPVSPFQPLDHGGAFLGTTACGTISDSFEYREVGKIFPHYAWSGSPDRPLAHTVLELSIGEAPMIYERAMPDGSFVKVEGPAIGVYGPV